MTKGVTQDPVLCQMSLNFPDKKMAKNDSNRCVCGTISVCVCLVDCFTQWSDIRCDSSELFTVPGLSESEERERGNGGRGRGENHVRSWRRREEFDCEQRRCTRLYVLAQRGFCPFTHHHLVMCDEGQACLWSETIPEVSHNQAGWYNPQASPSNPQVPDSLTACSTKA